MGILFYKLVAVVKRSYKLVAVVKRSYKSSSTSSKFEVKAKSNREMN